MGLVLKSALRAPAVVLLILGIGAPGCDPGWEHAGAAAAKVPRPPLPRSDRIERLLVGGVVHLPSLPPEYGGHPDDVDARAGVAELVMYELFDHSAASVGGRFAPTSVRFLDAAPTSIAPGVRDVPVHFLLEGPAPLTEAGRGPLPWSIRSLPMTLVPGCSMPCDSTAELVVEPAPPPVPVGAPDVLWEDGVLDVEIVIALQPAFEGEARSTGQALVEALERWGLRSTERAEEPGWWTETLRREAVGGAPAAEVRLSAVDVLDPVDSPALRTASERWDHAVETCDVLAFVGHMDEPAYSRSLSLEGLAAARLGAHKSQLLFVEGPDPVRVLGAVRASPPSHDLWVLGAPSTFVSVGSTLQVLGLLVSTDHSPLAPRSLDDTALWDLYQGSYHVVERLGPQAPAAGTP